MAKMKLALALCAFLLPASAYADGPSPEARIQALSEKLNSEIIGSLKCGTEKAELQEQATAILRDADQAQDELQDAGD